MSLYVYRAGSTSAPTIVFLHGSGVSSWMWNEQITALQSQYQCVAVDLPGNGESYQSEWLSFADTADQVAAIIREVSANGKAHVVGLSLGGYTGLYLLQRHADVIESVLVSGVSAKPFPNIWRWRLLLGIMQPLMTWDAFISLQAKMLHLPQEVMPLYKRDNKRMSREGFHRIYNEVLKFELPEFSHQQAIPLLAVAGDQENQIIKDSLKDFVNRKHNTAAALVPNAHHGWTGEHPHLFTNTVTAWIQQRPLPAELIPVQAN